MNVAVFGAGYVGLSLACLFARRSHVELVDVVEEKVDLINAGVSPIRDNLIEEALASAAGTFLHATLDVAFACKDAGLVIVATPTNYDDRTNSFDTSSIERVLDGLREIGSMATVVVKSTVPVGYTEELAVRYPGLNLLFSPEFLREGRALYDNLHPSRIIVGVPTDVPDGGMRARRFADELLRCSEEDAESVPVHIMGSTEAEAVKLFSNTYLALRVAFFNELDTYAEKRGLDASAIIEGVCDDPRIGDGYNNPSFGYGGYCLPKDTKQLLANYEDVPQTLIRAIVESNATRKHFIAQSVLERHPQRVGVYRLTMKQGSDNFRQSSVFDIIDELVAADVEVVVYEPLACEAEECLDDHSYRVTHDLRAFDTCDIVIANRVSDELEPYAGKVYTRDVWHTS